ncbi:hypothetical protein [Borrelia hermsii]|uniref:hypothetical protein n=1 Tax=Borrelia hermsii TaxID=140 RepID=UPI003AA818C3
MVLPQELLLLMVKQENCLLLMLVMLLPIQRRQQSIQLKQLEQVTGADILKALVKDNGDVVKLAI